MQIPKTRLTALFILLTALVVGMSSGCKPEYPAIELPPESSMIMETGDFTESGNKTLDTTTNWGYSAVNVVVWDAILFVNLAVPVTAFAESFNHEPKWNNREKAYIWAYDVVVGLNRYDVELLGSLEGSYVNWEMRLSQRNGFQDFVWFTGVSASNRTGGRWNLNRTPDNPEPYLEIDWYNDFAGEAWVKYTNIIPGAPENGAFIQYGTNLDPDFDRYYQIETIQNNKTTEIEWNYDNKNGRVRDEVQFGDTLWHCWDTALLDVNC